MPQKAKQPSPMKAGPKIHLTMKDAAIAAIRAGHNQYAPPAGIPPLRQAIARWTSPGLEHAVDPDAEVTVTSGCTEAIPAAMLGLINAGEEIILFEPFYDAYPAAAAMAGASVRTVLLRGPDFRFDERELRRAFTTRTAAILINTPHNPSGRVFDRRELELIANLCIEFGAIAIADEVYERLVFERGHVRIMSLPGMRDRTVTLSSLGKTFSLTGWKIGWAVASPELTRGIRAAHQFLTFATSTPMQHAAAAALDAPPAYFDEYLRLYRRRRTCLVSGLRSAGLGVTEPEGGYFVMADHSVLGFSDDQAFCRMLIEEIGVAGIPCSSFYRDRGEGSKYTRFAFCKDEALIEEGMRRLSSLRQS